MEYGLESICCQEHAAGRGLEDVKRDMARTGQHLTGGRPSLLQDVMRGRRTEIESLNGYVSREGRKVGVATPVNDAIVEIYRSHPPGTLEPDPRNLEPLLGLITA